MTFVAILLAFVLGLALEDRRAKTRALDRARTKLAEARADRDAALQAVEFGPDVQQPVWTTGAPQEAIDAEFDAITDEAWIRGES
jgi:hypothetical protein